MCVHWSYPRVIKSCGNAVWLNHLPICSLHHQALAAMKYPRRPELGGCCTKAAVNSMTCGLHSYQFNGCIINKMIESTCSITAPANTGKYMSRKIRTGFFIKLFPDLLTDDALE